MHHEDRPSDANPPWAANVIHTCIGVEPGEKVLIAVDDPLRYALDPFLGEALKAEPAEAWTYTFSNVARPFTEFPARLLDLATQMDAVVVLLASLDPVVEIPAHVAARSAITRGNPRYAIGAYIDRSILERELSADYGRISALTHSLADRLQGSSSVHVTTPLGTDLRLSVAGRPWRTDTGILRGHGVYGNLPAGEVFVAPVEYIAEGVLVVDKGLPGLELSEPVRLVFEGGKVVSIEGEPGRGTWSALREGEQKPNGERSRTIAELGIGTNPQARLQGNLMTDEKVAGTIHVAIGRNGFLGGKNLAPVHIDCVIGEPTLRVDGDLIAELGRE
jgi:leucyl aminopeptidase (aminopeptidase T)